MRSTGGPRCGSTAASAAGSTSRSRSRSVRARVLVGRPVPVRRSRAPARRASSTRSRSCARRPCGRSRCWACARPGRASAGDARRAGVRRSAGILRSMTTELPVDPALVEEAAALDIEAAAARHARAGRADRPREPAVPRRGRAGDQRRRVRPAVPRARRARDRLSRSSITPDSPTQRVGGTPTGATFDEVRHRRPMLSLVERVQPRRAARVRRARAHAASACRPRPSPPPDLRYVAELKIDGLAITPALRARPVRPGRDARRRHDRRGRDRQPADDQGRPGAADRAGHARGARRGLHAQGRVRADQRRARGGRAAALRQPAQQRRGLAPPEGPGGHRGPPAVGLVLPAGRGRRRGRRRQPVGGARRASRRSASRSTRTARPGLDIEGVIDVHRALARGAPRPAVRDRRRRRQGRPVRPAGAARHGQPRAALGDRLQVPARAGRDASSRTSSRTSAGPGR